ncbi:adenylosuccinate lyase [Spirochaetota bacterium]
MKDTYDLPFRERYSSKEMLHLFSDEYKFQTWRKLWVILAEAQKELGIKITVKQLSEMKKNVSNFDWNFIKQKEKELRHDVMAHIHGYAKVCPHAGPIIHLGATSAYVGDNTDIIQMREALGLIRARIRDVISSLKQSALKYKNLPTLGYTHFQPAQLTTVGKRICLWLQDLVIDYNDLCYINDTMPFRGVKGATGTQASYMKLLNNSAKKALKLDDLVTKKAGFDKKFFVTGQTYTRKIDYRVLSLLSSIAQSCAKFSCDMRLLMHKKEMEEPFEKKQVGSSAMAYKRNPMRSERISSLARFVMALEQTCAYTASTQWFERTLDDSANKRLSIPQAFLAVDAILLIYRDIADGMVVYPNVISKNLNEELPFIISENILMEGVKKGGNRQDLHEKIRQKAMKAVKEMKEAGRNNNFLDLIIQDNSFNLSKSDVEALMKPEKYIGRAGEQVFEFISKEVESVLQSYRPTQKRQLTV